MTTTSAARKANAIAWVYKITIYDALDVVLAEQVGYPLITADEVMIKSSRATALWCRCKNLVIKK